MRLTKDDPRWSEPSNHRFIPGYGFYGKYLLLKSMIPPGSEVLDVGCNCGQFGQNLHQELGCSIVGVDLNDEYIEYCRGNKPGEYHAMDFGQPLKGTPLAGRKFEVITCLEVIEHPISVSGFLRNFRLLMDKDSILIVTTPHAEGATGLEFRSGHHVHIWDEDELRERFKKAGLEMVEYHIFEHEGVKECQIAKFRLKSQKGRKGELEEKSEREAVEGNPL